MRRICVFCGSSDGASTSYADMAKKLGQTLARRKLGLVYGGGNVGLMGRLADAALAAGGEVIGVIPDLLKKKELAHAGLTNLYVVDSMHERKAHMAKLSDGFIALPGGIGTLEEFFEIWTWAQLGIHMHPFGILNVEGYYDALIKFMDHTVAQGFMKEKYRAMVFVETDPDALLDKMMKYSSPKHSKIVPLKKT
jgi:uncharacterized protein (TIGR00730 family)